MDQQQTAAQYLVFSARRGYGSEIVRGNLRVGPATRDQPTMMTPSGFENAYQTMSIVALTTDLHDVAGKRRGHGQEWRLQKTHAVPIEDLDLEGVFDVVVNDKSEEGASHHILLTRRRQYG